MSTPIVIPERELPIWMKRARRGTDWGVLLVIGFSLLIAWTFIENPNLPRTNDNIHYAFQAHDAAQSLREGRLYPRWSPYTLNGLRAPIPHYTPPGASYLTALIEVVFTNDTVFAMRIVYLLASVAAGLSVYALVMQRINAMAGLIAALLYVYSPYVSLTVPHVLGDLPQAIALALMPMLLWAVHRTLYRHKTALLYLPLISAILFLTSPQHFVLGWLLSGILIVVHLSESGGYLQVRTIALALCMGFGVSAFYWLPALYERNLVHWLPVSAHFPHYHLSFAELFARTMQLDSGALRHVPTFNLGWMLILSSGLSILLFRYGTRLQTIFLLAGIALILLGVNIFSSTTWLLGGLVLCLAIGGSTIGNGLLCLPRWLRYLSILLLMVTVFWLSLPIWMSQAALAPIVSAAPLEQMNYEARTGSVALLPPDELYPTTLPNLVRTTRNIDAEFDPNTFSRFQNTSPAQLTLSEQGIHYASYVLFAEEPATVIYEQAYFRGWQAELEQEMLPVESNIETGLIQIDLPAATNSTVTIFLGTVPIRAAAWIATYAMIGAAVFIVWQRWQRLPDRFDEQHLLTSGDVRLFAFLVLLGIATHTIPPISDMIYQLRRPAAYQIQNRTFANNSNDSHLKYQGYTLTEDAMSNTLTLSLYWEAVRESSEMYEVVVTVRNRETDTIIYTGEQHPPGDYPTALWTTNLYIEDRYQISIPQGTTTDEYLVEVNMWRCETSCDTPVNFYSPDSQLLGTTLLVPMSIHPD